MSPLPRLCLLPVLALLLGAAADKPLVNDAPIQVTPAQIRIASYNLYNFKPGEAPRQFKTEVSRAATAAVIAEMNADILLISELGPDPSLAELQAELKLRHADYPFQTVVRAADPTRHIAVLARFKPVEISHVTNSKYRIQGQDQPVLRGFAHALARLASLALQSGVPLATVARALRGTEGGPSGAVEDGPEGVEQADSVPDLVGRVLDAEGLK